VTPCDMHLSLSPPPSPPPPPLSQRAVPLAKSTTLQVTASHPTKSVSYRLGTVSDYGADLSTAVPTDKRGSYTGVAIDRKTGLVSLPPLLEPQLYSIVVIATLDTGVTTALDFYIEAVDGVWNDPPSLAPVRVPPAFLCGEENELIVQASDPQLESEIALVRKNMLMLLVRDVAAFQGTRALTMAVSGDPRAPMISVRWRPACEELSGNHLYDYRGRHRLETFAICIEALDDSFVPSRVCPLFLVTCALDI
jgi:hypothetical protein